jgi:type I restriction enzyme S subunit
MVHLARKKSEAVWPKMPLRTVAPPERAEASFTEDDVVWQLSLDQIESQTGRILKKVRARVSDAGTSTFAFDEKHVLYSKLRPYLNKVARPDEPGLATTELVPLRPVPGVIDAGFLTFYLRSDAFVNFANSTVAGAKMPRMIMDKFWEHRIPVPSSREQRRIAELLEQADALRCRRTEADTLASRILPAVFRKMFGDPAQNSHQLTRGLLGDIITEASYGTSVQSNTDSRGVAVIRMNSITTAGDLELSDLKYVELPTAELEKQRLRAGDLLFNRTNTRELVGKTGLWKGGVEAVAASYLIRLRVNQEKALPEFIWAWMNTPFLKQQLFEIARRAAGMANINTTEIRRLPLLLPAKPNQEEFAKRLASLNKNAFRRADSRKYLDTLFTVMLHRAFTGELTARWREAHMKELLAEMEQQANALS